MSFSDILKSFYKSFNHLKKNDFEYFKFYSIDFKFIHMFPWYIMNFFILKNKKIYTNLNSFCKVWNIKYVLHFYPIILLWTYPLN
jgi:hypothetical protein